MDSNTLWYALGIICAGGLAILLLAMAIRHYLNYGNAPKEIGPMTVKDLLFHEAYTTTTHIQSGKVSIPVTNHHPAYYEITLETPDGKEATADLPGEEEDRPNLPQPNSILPNVEFQRGLLDGKIRVLNLNWKEETTALSTSGKAVAPLNTNRPEKSRITPIKTPA